MSKKRSYNLNKTSKIISYSIDDVARLYNIHPQTVLKWIRQGLHKNDNKKPILIHGSILKSFLAKLNVKGKVNTKFEEMFCFHCKQSHSPYRRELFLKQENNKVLTGIGVCPKHKKTINKKFKFNDYSVIKKFYKLTEESSIYDYLDPIYKTQLLNKINNAQNESEIILQKDI